jgi:hypothetical protein
LKEQAAKRIAGASTGTRNMVRSLVNKARIAGKDRLDVIKRDREAKAGPSVMERQEMLIQFYNNYEELVEVLCDAAQYGPTVSLEARYSDLRERYGAMYCELRPLLGAFIRPVPEEDGVSRADAFQSLIAPESVADFLHSDDGAMISRITRTREALNLYGEHLRQLAAKVA